MAKRESLSAADVTRRLALVGELYEQRRRRRRLVDMSGSAVRYRLRRVSELRDLCLLLGRARRL